MFRHWVYIVMLSLIGVPLWAQGDRAIKREREEMISEQRVALVIGNAAYEQSPLKNPVNDVDSIAAALKACGFTVLQYKNLNRTGMFKAVRVFGESIKGGGVGLFYYSGHGIQVADKNYLVPVDADIQAEDEVEIVCLDMQSVLNKMETASNRVNILILDACRNNPYERRYRSSGRSGGLATIRKTPSGTFIAYATDPGAVADDGDGSNSPFTKALVQEMRMAGSTIEAVFRKVGERVEEETQRQQSPWIVSSLRGSPFYFVLPDTTIIVSLTLHEAAGLNRTEEVRRLLIEGTDVNVRNSINQTPLHAAARFNAYQTAEILLNQHADANLLDNAGETPLHVAARYNKHQIAELLLSKSADVNAQNSSGQTPFDIANLLQTKEIIGVLRGSVFRDCDKCPEMVIVPSGSFMMGSPDDEQGRDDSEGPLHRVNIEYPLAVGVYEVTFAEWDACVDDGGCGKHDAYDEGWGRGNKPVINVNWNDAQSYVRWLSKETGHRYGLLSEAEWEYVARAGEETSFHFGPTISTDQANYDGTSQKGTRIGMTTSVDSFRANSWGIHGIHGNVWEWMQDCWNDSYEGAPTDGSAWKSGDCDDRVLRGGSWSNGPGALRSAARGLFDLRVRDSRFGFRVVRRF